MSNPVLSQVAIKLYLAESVELNQDELIPVFHRWIREGKIPGYLLIDVADYRHVPEGPGVMLIADEAHYGLDEGDGRAGLLFARKRDGDRPAREAMKEAFERCAQAARFLEEESELSSPIRFDTASVELRVVSRLHASNTAESEERLAPIWSELLEESGYKGTSFEREEDQKKAFTLRLKTATTTPDLVDLAA